MAASSRAPAAPRFGQMFDAEAMMITPGGQERGHRDHMFGPPNPPQMVLASSQHLAQKNLETSIAEPPLGMTPH